METQQTESESQSQSRFDSRSEVLEEIDEVIMKVQSASPSETMELCHGFITDLAVAVAQDQIPESTKQECLSSLVEHVPFTKSHLISQYESAYESQTSTSDTQQQHLDEWLRDHVDKLEIIRSTDSHIDTSYLWTFTDGTTVETKREQFDWSELSRVLTAANHEFAFREPSPDLKNKSAWKFEFVQPFLREHAESRLVTGSRSDAIQELQNMIQSTRGYSDIRQAYQTTGIYLDTEEPEYVYVASAVIAQIADEQSVTTRALQVECDARGIVNGSVSVTLSIGDNRQSRFWQLPRSFAKPQRQPGTETETETETGTDSDGNVTDQPRDTHRTPTGTTEGDKHRQ